MIIEEINKYLKNESFQYVYVVLHHLRGLVPYLLIIVIIRDGDELIEDLLGFHLDDDIGSLALHANRQRFVVLTETEHEGQHQLYDAFPLVVEERAKEVD
jgi:hypothetical protein